MIITDSPLSKVVHYKWFSVFYLFAAIILLPLLLVGLSLLNTILLYIIVTLLTGILVFVELVNYLQRNHPKRLPRKLKTWEFLPLPLRSLSTLDFVIQTYTEVFFRLLAPSGALIAIPTY